MSTLTIELKEPKKECGSGIYWIGAFLLLLVIMVLTAKSGVEQVTIGPASVANQTYVPSQHALDKHGDSAEVAVNMVNNNGDCRVCTDGRKRCISEAGGQWAVVISELSKGQWINVSAFLTTQNYASSVKEGCDPGWKERLHP